MARKKKVVHNLVTGKSRIFDGLPARDALVAAWEQDRGNWNTWTYADSKCPIREGEFYLGADDLTVKKDDEADD